MEFTRLRIPAMVLSGVLAMATYGAPLTPAEALARLGADASGRKAPTTSQTTLAYTARAEKAGADAYYVFQNDGRAGFIIVSADDRLPALLARVDSGIFDMHNMPENVSWWLGEYTREIDHFLTESEAHSRIITPGSKKFVGVDSRHYVAPMVKAEWNQYGPYNDLCPEYRGSRCLTGCVATAIAQVMKYHNYPERGIGSNSYEWNGQTLSYDFGATEFDWSSMLDSYSSTYGTTAQRKAVAELMLACGMSVDMDYNPGASAALSASIAFGLKEYFGYGEGTSFVMRDGYSTVVWEDMIYEEMAAGRPVLYSGVSSDNAGHQFVCDGYMEGSLYHINWGWSGLYNGFFRLSALEPEGVGAGGGMGEYNYRQDAIIGIAPPSQEQIAPVIPLACTGNFTVGDPGTYNVGPIKLQFNITDGYILNESRYNFSGMLGLLMTRQGVDGVYMNGASVTFKPLHGYSLSGFSGYKATVNSAGLEPGDYMLTPAFKDADGNWHPVPVNNGRQQYVTMTVVGNGDVTFSNNSIYTKPELEVTAFSADGEVKAGEMARFNISYVNGNTPFDGVLSVNAREVNGEPDVPLATLSTKCNANVKGDGTAELNLGLPHGAFSVFFKNELGEVVSPDFTITVTEAPSAIDAIGVEGDSEVVEYYRPDGVRLSSRPESGIVIERRGSAVVKKTVK